MEIPKLEMLGYEGFLERVANLSLLPSASVSVSDFRSRVFRKKYDGSREMLEKGIAGSIFLNHESPDLGVEKVGSILIKKKYNDFRYSDCVVSENVGINFYGNLPLRGLGYGHNFKIELVQSSCDGVTTSDLHRENHFNEMGAGAVFCRCSLDQAFPDDLFLK